MLLTVLDLSQALVNAIGMVDTVDIIMKLFHLLEVILQQLEDSEVQPQSSKLVLSGLPINDHNIISNV